MEEWDVSLDSGPGDSAESPRPRVRLLLVAAACVALVVGFLVWRPQVPEGTSEAPPRVTELGNHLVVPVKLRTPGGAVATANGGYVGLQYANYGSMLVTTPTGVVQPGGLRTVLPADPVAWIEQHPDVFVSRVHQVTVAGQKVTQLDYRRSRDAQPQSEFARLPLFCAAAGDCTRITPTARVRATFVPVAGKLVLVEAVWRTDGTITGRQMPPGLRKAYQQLLASLTTSSPGRGPSS